jgi:hypothetical protein
VTEYEKRDEVLFTLDPWNCQHHVQREPYPRGHRVR